MTLKSKRETRLVSHLVAHPVSDIIFGPMGDEEYQELKEDIAERGIRHPLELDLEGRVICGSQRLRALKELNVEIVDVEVVDLETEDEIVKHLIKDNLLRRHLTPGMIYKAGRELERIKANGRSPTVKEIAGELGKVTSYSTYWRIRKIMESGDKELIKSVENGETNVSAAHKQLKSHLKQRRSKGDSRSKDVMMYIRYRKRLERIKLFLKQNPMGEFGTYSKDARRALRDTIDTAQDLAKA